MGLGWSKSTDSWAKQYVNENVPDVPCDIAANLADLQQDEAMKAEACAGWVKSQRFGASRANALSSCSGYINQKYQCAIQTAESNSYNNDNKIRDKYLSASSPLVYVLVFAALAAIMYLLMS